MTTVPELREGMAQARRLAESVSDPTAREQLETAARDYDEMADQLEDDTVRANE